MCNGFSVFNCICHQNSSEKSSSCLNYWDTLRNSLVQADREHLGYAHHVQADWFIASQNITRPLLEEQQLHYHLWVSSLASDYAKFQSGFARACAAVRLVRDQWLVDVAQQAELGRTSYHSGSVWSAICYIQCSLQGLRPMLVLAIKNEDKKPCMQV